MKTPLVMVVIAGVFCSSAAIAGNPISPEDLKLTSDFNGAVGNQLDGKTYGCQGEFKFVTLATPEDPKNQALSITLDPQKPTDPDKKSTCHSLRAEIAEAKAFRLPLETDVWYSLRFFIPQDMNGKIGSERFVLAQLKQSTSSCKLGGSQVGITAIDDYNPTISLRVIEDVANKLVGVELDVSSENVRKIVTGTVMRRSESFFGSWHTFVLHTKVVPRLEGDQRTSLDGFVAGSLDGQSFGSPAYGRTIPEGSTTEIVEVWEPFGYPEVKGCTYFKFGIYRDAVGVPWTVSVGRFRRGATETDVQ